MYILFTNCETEDCWRGCVSKFLNRLFWLVYALNLYRFDIILFFITLDRLIWKINLSYSIPCSAPDDRHTHWDRMLSNHIFEFHLEFILTGPHAWTLHVYTLLFVAVHVQFVFCVWKVTADVTIPLLQYFQQQNLTCQLLYASLFDYVRQITNRADEKSQLLNVP